MYETSTFFLHNKVICTYVWQPHVEIEGYSVAYFNRIAVFEAPYHWTSVKGGAHTCFVVAWISNESMKLIWTVLRRKPCDQKTRQNNLRFLHGTATCAYNNYYTCTWPYMWVYRSHIEYSCEDASCGLMFRSEGELNSKSYWTPRNIVLKPLYSNVRQGLYVFTRH